MKKTSLLIFTFLTAINTFANKTYTIYYHDPHNRGRKIWVWDTGIDDYDNKSDDSHNKLKNSTRSDDHYTIFEIEAKDDKTPSLDFVKANQDNTPDWNSQGSKDMAIRDNVGGENIKVILN